jgi:hypothetical protein
LFTLTPVKKKCVDVEEIQPAVKTAVANIERTVS